MPDVVSKFLAANPKSKEALERGKLSPEKFLNFDMHELMAKADKDKVKKEFLAKMDANK